jgi:hypothetical protein
MHHGRPDYRGKQYRGGAVTAFEGLTDRVTVAGSESSTILATVTLV